MAYHNFKRSICVVPPIITQIGYSEIQSDNTLGCLDSIQLLVGQIARSWAKSVRIRMCSHQWRIRQVDNIPKTLLIKMRQVEHDSQTIADTYQFSPGSGESRSSIRRTRKSEWHTMSKGIRTHRQNPPQYGTL